MINDKNTKLTKLFTILFIILSSVTNVLAQNTNVPLNEEEVKWLNIAPHSKVKSKAHSLRFGLPITTHPQEELILEGGGVMVQKPCMLRAFKDKDGDVILLWSSEECGRDTIRIDYKNLESLKE